MIDPDKRNQTGTRQGSGLSGATLAGLEYDLLNQLSLCLLGNGDNLFVILGHRSADNVPRNIRCLF